VLGFVVLDGDFEHVVAADADAMDFRGRLAAEFGFGCVRGLSVLGFAHERILA
jgi:hypothetical protein